MRDASRLVGEEGVGLIKRGLEYEPDPPLGPIDWEPTVVESLRPIWREPLPDVLAKYPNLDRRKTA
jgi:hypothetical protein